MKRLLLFLIAGGLVFLCACMVIATLRLNFASHYIWTLAFRTGSVITGANVKHITPDFRSVLVGASPRSVGPGYIHWHLRGLCCSLCWRSENGNISVVIAVGNPPISGRVVTERSDGSTHIDYVPVGRMRALRALLQRRCSEEG